jgi:hypothetical protein
MNKIKVDKERMNSIGKHLFNCPYKYEFDSNIFNLETDSKESHNLENYIGHCDARDIVFETILKDFVITLRKSIYKDNEEEMICTNLKDLIKFK